MTDPTMTPGVLRERLSQAIQALTADAASIANDPINPEHYKQGPVEVIDIIEGFGLNFHLGNVVKYVLRHGLKGGVEDLEKARWYLDREIQRRKAL